jgi:5-methylcytosine-specific restriction endonuclease McrA
MERALEQLVWQRAGSRCEYCQLSQQFDDTIFQTDHVIAASHGGATELDNLCLACFAWKKQQRYP